MRFHPNRMLVGALAYTAGMVGEVVDLLTATSRWGRRGASSPSRPIGLISLRQAIFGHTKRDVVFRLGPPRASTGSEVAGFSSFWHAGTWYYPFDPKRQTALVVRFNQDRVIGIEVLGGMKLAAKVG